MCAGEEKGVLSKVELILPANVVEACYNLERNVHAYFMAVNQQDRTSSEITLYKLKDDSVKIRVTVLALGDEEEETTATPPTPPKGGKRKRKDGGGDDEPSTSKPKKKPEPEPSPAKKGKGKGKGVKEEDPEPSTPQKSQPPPPAQLQAVQGTSDVEPSPGRLRTAKVVGNKASAPSASLQDFIPEEGDLTEEQGDQGTPGDEVLVVGQNEGEEDEPQAVNTPTPPPRPRAKPRARKSPGNVEPLHTVDEPQGLVQEEEEEGEEEAMDMYEEEERDPNTTASTVITVKKAIKSEQEKAAERVRKVQMGRPWNWGKKTTLVYERKEKTFPKKMEGDEDEEGGPKQTETLVIKNKIPGKGPVSVMEFSQSVGDHKLKNNKARIVKIVKPQEGGESGQGDGPDPDMPPIVLASEDGAIISADALELTDAMGGSVQVQVITQEGNVEGEQEQVLEITPTIKEQTIEVMPSSLKTPKMKNMKRNFNTPLSAPAKVSMSRLKQVEEIPCQICDTHVIDYEALLKHVKKNHMDVDGVDDYLEEVQMEMQVECPVCNVAVESQSVLTMHIERQHSHIGTEIRCEPCNKTYKSAASLKNHIRQQHTARRRFECHVCSATFTETRSLREHINCVHETTETFDCDVCSKTFLTKGRLRRHKYIHGGFRHYCEYCNKGFHLRDNMNKHVEIMHEQKFGKRFQCNYCGKAFTVKGNLQQHILGVHLKKSLYECPICNEGFKRKSMMLDHMKTHARPKTEPGTTANMVETVDAETLARATAQAQAQEGDTSGEEDYDYVEFD